MRDCLSFKFPIPIHTTPMMCKQKLGRSGQRRSGRSINCGVCVCVCTVHMHRYICYSYVCVWDVQCACACVLDVHKSISFL
jgi:hypothetical protein